MRPPPVLILAAGRSTRMRGRDKLVERIGDEPLLRRQARIALEVSDRVLVTLPAPDHPRAALLAGLPVSILTPPEAAEGLSGSLRAGVEALPACDRFLVLLADLPELTQVDLRKVM
ncbi:MAG: NTP transferase domain-containing protein, partial [Rubellimicrobium sp.]|nr:NTP transferase domain-containing protein [Rubellimicrobium sp.]